jgi:hypothetical protein
VRTVASLAALVRSSAACVASAQAASEASLALHGCTDVAVVLRVDEAVAPSVIPAPFRVAAVGGNAFVYVNTAACDDVHGPAQPAGGRPLHDVLYGPDALTRGSGASRNSPHTGTPTQRR